MTKPLPPHGTYARYYGRPHTSVEGCRCEACTTESRRYYKRRDYLARTGRPLTVDAGPARKHLKALFAAGAGWTQIAAASGHSTSVIHGVITGQRREIRRRTEQDFLSVRLDQVLPADRYVSALGSIRRVRALAAIGHGAPDIAAAIGMGESLTSALLSERFQRVRVRTHSAIAAGFTRLAMTPGGNRRIVNRARREGWAPPLAWDGDMDDPDAAPVVLEEPVLNREEQAAIRAAEVVHLAAYGLSHEDIGARIGMTAKYVSEVLHKERRKLRVA